MISAIVLHISPRTKKPAIIACNCVVVNRVREALVKMVSVMCDLNKEGFAYTLLGLAAVFVLVVV